MKISLLPAILVGAFLFLSGLGIGRNYFPDLPKQKPQLVEPEPGRGVTLEPITGFEEFFIEKAQDNEPSLCWTKAETRENYNYKIDESIALRLYTGGTRLDSVKIHSRTYKPRSPIELRPAVTYNLHYVTDQWGNHYTPIRVVGTSGGGTIIEVGQPCR